MTYKQEIQREIKHLENLMEKRREDYPEASMNISRAIQDLSNAKDKVIEKNKPEECIVPICENQEPKHPVNRPRYCLECYRMKAD